MSAFTPNNDTPAFLAALFDSSADAVIGTDLDGVVLTLEPQCRTPLRLFQSQTSSDEQSQSSFPLTEPTSLRACSGASPRESASGPTTRCVAGKDGQLVEVSLTVGARIAIPSGRVIGASATAHDITLTETGGEGGRRVSEARWHAVFDSAVDGIIVIDAQGRVEEFNPGAERMFGYEASEVIGRNVSLLMPSPYHEEHDRYMAALSFTGVPRIIGIGREVTGLRKDGTTFRPTWPLAKWLIGEERRFSGILHDLTTRVRLEAQLREQAALASLGEMAAVIAHEVRNPLAGVRGAVEVVGARLPKESADGAIVQEIVARIDGLNGLMQDLLLFARPPRPKSAPVEIHKLVRLTADLLSRNPALAALHVEVRGSHPPILADPDLLRIVFENLIVNGAHAMNDAGTLQVEVRAVDGTCHISVIDSGPGIPAEMRDKIFLPFFTTKSRGSGLGLPTAKRLVEAHRGTISVSCPPDGGTTVTVQLPA